MTGATTHGSGGSDEGFLLDLADAVGDLTDSAAIVEETGRRLGERLGLGRLALIERSPGGEGDERVLAWTAGEARVGSRLEIPVDSGDGPSGALLLDRASPGGWTPREVRLAGEVARRTWRTLQRARAGAELRVRQAHHAFLLALSDRTRGETDPEAVIAVTCERLGRYVGARRVAFCELAPGSGGRVVASREWTDGLPAFSPVPQPWESLNPAFREALEQGRLLSLDDLAAAPELSGHTNAVSEAYGNAALLAVPLIREGALAAYLLVADGAPRRWDRGDFALVQEVAERTWSTLHRARAEARLRVANANQAFLLDLADRIRGESDPEAILSITAERVGRYLGISRIVYSELSASGDTFLSPYQWVDRVPKVQPTDLADLDPDAMALLNRGTPLRVDDIRALPGLVGAEALAASGTRSFLCVPLVKGGRYVATLAATCHRPHPWSDSDVFLLSELAERTWSTLQRARAEAELEKSRAALHQSEKLTALGSLLAGVSHELNNPLSVVVGQALIMEEKAPDEATAARAAKIRSADERCARIVQTFLAMARQREPEKQRLDVNGLVEAALDLTAYGLRAAGVRVETRLQPRLPQPVGDAGQLHQLFANLIINAQHALEEHPGERALTVSTRSEEDGIVIDFADSGPGIAPDIRSRIFDPFFTTKPVGSGTGLGLSFAYGVARAHGGDLRLVETEDGALFRILLPLARESGGGRDRAAPAEAARGGTALVVDDEAELAETLAEMLEARGWRVVTAVGGRAGLDRLRDGEFDLVVTDLRMPEVDGPAIYDWVRENRPALAGRVVFLTGDTLGPAANRFLESCGRPFAEKPFTPESIARLIEASGWPR